MGAFVKTRIVPHRNVYLILAIGAVAIAVRLLEINQPFVDRWSWRQSDVASIARNYYTNGFHFSYPQIDWAGDQPGYVGTEFPILPFCAALCYKFTGIHEWIGRLQSLVFFAVSVPFFFLLVRAVFGPVAAAWATFFYGGAPLSIMTSRCFMPDMPSLSLAIVGLYMFLRWTDRETWSLFFAAAVTFAFAFLIKLPTALIGASVAYLTFSRFGRSTFRRGRLWLFAALTLIPSAIWYWHAHRVAQEFYPHHFFGAGGFQIMNASWYGKIGERIVSESLTATLVLLAAAGLLIGKGTKRVGIFYWWLIVTIVFILVAGYGNRHPWYQLPLLPIAAAFAGCALQWVTIQLTGRGILQVAVAVAVVVIFAAESYKATRPLYQPTSANLQVLGLALRKTPEESLIVVADYGDPTAFYYGERRGWHFLEK
ncbi:MAG: hypothetical protein QOI34_1943, partial [Verrucomicrobiota bacterium]